MTFDGPLLADRWRLGPRLGGGAQAKTYLASDEEADGERVVVVKRLSLAEGKSWKSFDLFEREIRTLEGLQHPGIPRYLESFESDGGVMNLVMERAPGESLRGASAKLDESDLRDILRRALKILIYLHGLRPPIIHRDIKPANLVRDADGRLSLVDFGGVRDTLRTGGGSTVVGTFGYMAPEQLHGDASPATDIYGLGATVVALAGGVEPENVPRKGLRMDLESHLRNLDPKLRAVVAEMTAPDPDDRPQSAKAVLALLDASASRPRRSPGHALARREPTETNNEVERRDDIGNAAGEVREFIDGLPGPARAVFRVLMFLIGAGGWLGLTVVRYAVLPIGWVLVNLIAGSASGTRRDIERGLDEARSGFAALAGRSSEPKRLPPADD